MKDIEKFRKLYEEIPVLIALNIDSDAPEFTTWQTKVQRFLAKYYGPDSKELKDFMMQAFWPTVIGYSTTNADYIRGCQEGLKHSQAVFKVYIEEMEDDSDSDSLASLVNMSPKTLNNLSDVFIVHGHNEALKQSVARLIEKQGINAIILHEQPNKGATIIEKFEHNSNVGAAICLFTADDNGRAIAEEQLKKRARQNVVFEAGFFMGSLGRDHVIILAERGVELPSDLKGVVYTDTSSWQLDVLRELRAMGFSVDYNKID